MRLSPLRPPPSPERSASRQELRFDIFSQPELLSFPRNTARVVSACITDSVPLLWCYICPYSRCRNNKFLIFKFLLCLRLLQVL